MVSHNRVSILGCTTGPMISCRLGAAFIRMVIEPFPIYTCAPIMNNPMLCLTSLPYDSKLGVGQELISYDGLPAVMKQV